MTAPGAGSFPDAAEAIEFILTRPRHVMIGEPLIRPAEQAD